jgi:hypothetical protein
MRDGVGGKKMQRGKAHTVVGEAHHEDRGHLTWQRAPPASQLTREENSVRGRGIAHEVGVAHEREGVVRGKGRNRAREAGNTRRRVEARREQLRPPCVCHRACVPLVFWGAYSNPNRPNWKPNRPHIGPVEQAQKKTEQTTSFLVELIASVPLIGHQGPIRTINRTT